jgi:uncharacterized membrane protein
MATAGVATREWTFGRTLWFTVVMLGWFALAYVAATVPGGLYAAAEWIGTLNPAAQILMWLLLLPYMMAMWVWNSTWELWARVLGVGGLVLATLLASRPRQRRSAWR